MIVSLSISNFRSIYDEQTISLVASDRVTSAHENHISDIPNHKNKILKTAVIYGANGAGKSNIFKALRYMERMILTSKGKSTSGTNREYFKFNADAQSRPSEFDLQFISNAQLYRYGFKVNDSNVLEEWLIKGQNTVLFERVTSEQGDVTVEVKKLDKNNDKSKKIDALATVGGLSNQLFLSTINANIKNSDLDEHYSAVLDWFKNTLTLIAPTESAAMLGHQLANNQDFLTFAGNFLKASSTGVDSLAPNKIELSEEQLRNLLPKSIVNELVDSLDDDEQTTLVQLGEGNELIIERKDGNKFFKITIQAVHNSTNGSNVSLDLTDESDGTRRLLNLMPALHKLQTNNSVFFIDEIDRSMHPILVWKFLEFFLNSCDKGHRQIIVTTHETNLLHLDLLRRDEIWFTEKNENLETQLYSLADFKVRNDLDIRKHYLQGRFGAIPFMGDIKNLPTL